MKEIVLHYYCRCCCCCCCYYYYYYDYNYNYYDYYYCRLVLPAPHTPYIVGAKNALL